MNINDIHTWIKGYVLAWNFNNPEHIGRLFAAQARYYTAPYRAHWEGRQQVIAGWLSRKDESDQGRSIL